MFIAVLNSESRWMIANSSAGMPNEVARNLRRGVDRLTGLVDEVVAAGAFPLSATPEVQSMAEELDSATFERLIEIVGGIGVKVQRKLERHFAADGSVAVLNLKAAWDRVQDPSSVDAMHARSDTSR